MASKKALEVVATLQTEHDLEELLSSRLAHEISNEVDMGRLAKLTIAKIAGNLKARFIEWLSADTSSYVALNETEAIAGFLEEVGS